MPEITREAVNLNLMTDLYTNIDASRKEVVGLVQQLRIDLKEDISRVERKFDTMEAGRLTRLEKDFAGLTATVAVQGTKEKQTSKIVWIFLALGVAIIQAVVTALIVSIITKPPVK